MADEIHPVVALLVARRESHPQEFEILYEKGWSAAQGQGRWEGALAMLGWYLNPAERELLHANRRELIFDKVYEYVAERLLVGAD